MDDLEERWAKRDQRRAVYEAEMERRRQEHRARPLVERLRDCGTFIAADGYPSYAPPRADDAKEAADEIERLQKELAADHQLIREACGCIACFDDSHG